ncbi:MAG: hypothetical protein ACREDS_00280 [Limisphaerales bacterium]
MMKQPLNTANHLPDDVRALFFVCDCFGLGEHQLDSYRMKLNRARSGSDISPEERERIRQSLFLNVRKAIQTPVSRATFVTDNLAIRLLELYAKVRPHLLNPPASNLNVLWLVAERVLVPTAYLIIRRKQHLGLGTEFLGVNCWYLPQMAGQKVRKPVQRVLDCWLRVAGLRTDYRVSKEIGTETVRRKVNRWLEGKNQPTLLELYQLIDEFSGKVKWLDEPDSWKARFTLACAAQRAWDKVDSFFKPVCPAPARQLTRTFCDLAGKPVLNDERGLLTLPDTFFASCLLQSCLKQEGKLEEILAPARQNRNASFGVEDPDEKIEKWRRQAEWEANPGNWFLEFIQKQATAKGHFKRGGHTALKEHLFNLGIEELNRLVREQNKRAGR